ncbi:hypothetical protein OEZ85_013077 [Tetradesmus obliquus]|uniref:HTH La-type RNA-binding domain-containing protein n=1 Tax=Tetradesmus obliquus TaxID=3088 RepID=A0ABY8U9R1_TETOB|nr:hypothetical protein OEZ85_013077 [Tetradesmus obliquus]
MAATAVFVLWSEDTEPPSRAMTDVVASPVAGLTSADSAGEETEHSLLSATSAGEEGSDGDTSGPAGAAGKPTDHAEVMAAVKKQVEFYFSDANLPTDKHLLKQIQKDAEGYVPLRMIANFKRVKALTKELTVVAEALRSSSLLSLDAEGTRVRRAAPLPAFDVGDITWRTVVVEHLPDKPTIESVTQLLAQYGRVVMVRICSRGNTSKLPAWLAKAVESINVTMAPGEFALVEFGSEEDCVACVTKTKNPDNWRTSLRVRHLLTNFKPSTKASSSSSSGARPRSSLDHGSRHEAEAAGHHGKPHGREREHSGTGDGRRTTSSRRSSHDGAKRASHDGYSQQQQHRDERAGSSAAAAAAADLPVHLSPIRTHAADAAAQQQQRSASPYANGAARMNGVVSPSPALSPVRTGTSGVGGSIGSPRTVPSPAPAAVTSLIDSILSAPTASTPTRDARSSAGGGLSAGDAVAEALESLGLGGGGSSSSRPVPVGSPDLSSSPKPAPWVPASRLQHMQQAAAHDHHHHSRGGNMRSSGSEAEDNSNAAGSWRSSWTGQAGSPLGGSHMRPPKHRTSGSGSASQSGGKQRRRSWHTHDDEVEAAAPRGSSSGAAVEGNNSDGGAVKGPGGSSSSSGRRSRLAQQQGGDAHHKSNICAIREASGELEALVAAAAAEAGSSSTQLRRRSSHTGHDAGSSSRDAGEEQDDEHEDGEHDHDSEHGKRRRRRHRGSGSRRASLDESHPGGSRRQSLEEGSRGGSRRQSLDESGGRYGGSSSSRPGSRAGAPSPLEDAAAAGQHAHGQHSRPHSSCSAGGGKPHSHHGSPSPASHMPGERRGSHDGSAAAAKEAGSKKKEKKDYASWAAATPEFRAAAAAAKHSGGGNGNSSSSSAALGSSPARAGLSPMRASGGGGSVASGHDGDSHVRIARMPDGSRGFGMGRGRALTPPPQ